MKGYLTVFLAMSLSILAGFILLLTGSAITNAEKVRLECALDTGMNAVLSEFHAGLFERYGLIYVDASYLGRQPSVSNVEERLKLYLEANTSQVLDGKNAPWGSLTLQKADISSFSTAADQGGASMRSQAACYAEDAGLFGPERQVCLQINELQPLVRADPVKEWTGIMEQLSGMELPKVLNEEGIWEEVPLSNPADWVYGLMGSDVLYLGEIDLSGIDPVHIALESYISHRQTEDRSRITKTYEADKELFLSYLFDKMGYLGAPREASLLDCQLEYLAKGKDSDLENVRAAAETIFSWRFADNVLCAFTDGDLRARAAAEAEQLQAVQLKEEFKEPVVESILYACAFLESIGDIRAVYHGGTIPIRKSAHQMKVEHVLGGSLYTVESSSGYSYSQYLACMLWMQEESEAGMRAMDIMEMDIRLQEGNNYFSMDWCIEQCEADVSAKGSYGHTYSIKRRYGYF